MSNLLLQACCRFQSCRRTRAYAVTQESETALSDPIRPVAFPQQDIRDLGGASCCSTQPQRCTLLVQATDASKQLPPADLQPPAPRPKTSAAVARRLIGSALGNATLRDKVTTSVSVVTVPVSWSVGAGTLLQFWHPTGLE